MDWEKTSCPYYPRLDEVMTGNMENVHRGLLLPLLISLCALVMLLLVILAMSQVSIIAPIVRSEYSMQWWFPLSAIVALLLTYIYLLFRNNFGVLWVADQQGLTVLGLFGRKFVPWDSVQRAFRRYSGIIYGSQLILQTDSGDIAVPMRSTYLAASIRQHLNRLGKAEGMKLPDRAESVFALIPNDVQHRMEWINSNPPGRWMTAAEIRSSIPLFIIVTLIPALRRHARWDDLLLICLNYAAIFALGIWHRSRNRRVGRFIFDDVGFEAHTAWGVQRADWTDIADARWTGNEAAIRLKVASQPNIEVPWDKNPGLMLAIIRSLRRVAKPIQIPVPDELLTETDN